MKKETGGLPLGRMILSTLVLSLLSGAFFKLVHAKDTMEDVILFYVVPFLLMYLGYTLIRKRLFDHKR